MLRKLLLILFFSFTFSYSKTLKAQNSVNFTDDMISGSFRLVVNKNVKLLVQKFKNPNTLTKLSSLIHLSDYDKKTDLLHIIGGYFGLGFYGQARYKVEENRVNFKVVSGDMIGFNCYIKFKSISKNKTEVFFNGEYSTKEILPKRLADYFLKTLVTYSSASLKYRLEI